ncbi:MAG: type II 3-dehydroquinate dehydratase [Burkholderiales bacterium]|nr:type II 3-dehydroquinate dehydratase [Burkholderiales bacterium]
MKNKTLLILNGPGLADLSAGGDRYGGVTLEQIQEESAALCAELGMDLEFRQTDDQDEMIRWIARDSDHFGALIINPVGYLKAGSVDFDMYRSAIKMIAHLNKPVIEVRLTNIFPQRRRLQD